MAAPTPALAKHFRRLKDPRRKHRRLHPLANILTIASCAVIGGADGWTDLETFGRQRKEWFARFLDLSHGIPSHDTFERVFDRIDPHAFPRCRVGEDASRIQRRHGGENFAALRRLALMLLKRHPGKGSIRSKRYAATISESFLEELLIK